jgi:DNA replication and repair protein RecF
MRITRVRASDFRNLTFADVDTDAPRVFLLGANGQGKTNLIEAAGLVTALRSFRVTDIEPLVRIGCNEARVRVDVDLGPEGTSAVEAVLAKGSRRARVDGAAIPSTTELVSRFPTVVFCSDDLRLVRGSPGNRRRWLDLALSGTDPSYLRALRAYTRALESRNALLKTGVADDAQFDAIEHAMLAPASTLAATRREALAQLAPELREVCDTAGFPNLAQLEAKPDTAEDMLAQSWREGRRIDRSTETTRRGPHRDDFDILFGGHPASTHASEGQQRLVVLALCLAQLRRADRRASTPPVILADDVLGELDEQRRLAFWSAVGTRHQVLATGTTPPPDGNWRVYQVENGVYRLLG